MTKVIFIDWDDTIGDWATSALKAQQEVYNKHHFAEFWSSFEDYFAAYQEHNVWLWAEYAEGRITKEFLARDFTLYPLVQALGGSELLYHSKPLQTLADTVCEEFLALTNKFAQLLPGAKETVDYLRTKYDLVIVSNGFTDVQYDKVNESGIRDRFLEMVMSEEAGVNKPDKRFFEIAFERTNKARVAAGKEPVTKDEIILIGDGYGSDIEGAKNFGIDQIFICHNEETLNDTSKTATYKVMSLADVADIL